MNALHFSMSHSNPRLAIVDDDRSAAVAAGWDVERAGYAPFIVDGPYQDVDILVEYIMKNAQGALCDHRLTHRGFANFSGALLVASLVDKGVPAILMTQYKEIDIDVSIRKWRHKIPVLLSRDETNASTIRAGIAACVSELSGNVPITRWPHRVLLRITDIGEESKEKVVDVIIPSWNPQRAVRFPASLMPEELQDKLEPDVRLFALVNIGAETSDELYFQQFELASEPDEDDGLA